MDRAGQVKTVSNALRNRWPVLVAVLLACLLAGVAAITLVPRTYQAESLLLVDARTEGGSDPASALSASDTLARLYIVEATSGPLLQQVAAQHNFGVSAARLAKQVTASTVHGTTLVAITATGRSADQAAQIANAVANALVDRNSSDVISHFASSRTYLEGELARLDASIKAVQNEKPANTPTAIGDHAARLSLLQGQYSGIYTQLQSLALAQSHGISTLSVNALAASPTAPISPDPLRYLLAALVGGLCLSVLAALLVERFDDRVYTAEGLADATGVPLIVSAPSSAELNGRASPVARNAYGLALASVMARNPGSKMLMVVPAAALDRAGGIATGIGKAAVHGGQKVMIVRADADAAGIPQMTTSNGSGLTIVPLPSIPDARQAVGSLANGAGPYDFTVFSMRSPQVDPSAIALASTAKLAILVATAKKTRYGEARATADALRQAGLVVAACVLVARRDSGTHEGSTGQS